MSNKLRSINTKFWEDPWIEELNPKDKLLFLYLLSNSKTNMLGIYEVSLSKISFETGLTKQEIGKAFEGFERVNKAFYIDNYVVLANFLKNQKYNTNMKKSATKEFSNLPKLLKDKLSCNDSEGFERLIKGFEMLSKIEVEVEDEIEEEYKDEYLSSEYYAFAQKYIDVLIEKDKAPPKKSKATKADYDNIRKMVEVDGFSFQNMKDVANFYTSNMEKDFAPLAYSTKSFREKFNKIKDFCNRIS